MGSRGRGRSTVPSARRYRAVTVVSFSGGRTCVGTGGVPIVPQKRVGREKSGGWVFVRSGRSGGEVVVGRRFLVEMRECSRE